MACFVSLPSALWSRVFLCKNKTNYPKVELLLHYPKSLELLLLDWLLAESNFASTDAAQCLVRSLPRANAF
jgi:hypothetical protein